MKIKGASNKEISQATNTPIKTVGNLVSKGGRLFPAIQSLRQTKEVTLIEHNLSSWDSLLAAKDPAIGELKRLALESTNEAVRLKAIDMVIDLTGIKETDKPPLLDPHRQNESLNKFLEWINDKLLRSFGENSPKVTVSYSPQSSTPDIKRTAEDLDRMERIAKELTYLEDQRRNDSNQRGEVTNVES